MPSGFIPSAAGIAALARSPEFMAGLGAIANQVLSIAQGTAPVLTGAYRSGMSTEAGDGEYRVVSSDFKTLYLEFGTGHPGPTPAFHVLRGALEASGLRVGG